MSGNASVYNNETVLTSHSSVEILSEILCSGIEEEQEVDHHIEDPKHLNILQLINLDIGRGITFWFISHAYRHGLKCVGNCNNTRQT